MARKIEAGEKERARRRGLQESQTEKASPEDPEEAPQPVKVKTPTVAMAARQIKIGRTLAEIKDTHIALTGPGEPKAIRDFAEAFLGFAEGRIEEEEYIETIEKLLRERSSSRASGASGERRKLS